jgi:hypothetical protein
MYVSDCITVMSAPAAKGLVRAGDDDRADVLVGLEGGQRAAQFVHQVIVQGIQLLRAVESDQADFSAHFGVDVDVAHKGNLQSSKMGGVEIPPIGGISLLR